MASSATIKLRADQSTPLTIADVDANFKNINDKLAAKVDTSEYTAADVFAKILTLDTDTSGLNANLLQGSTASTSNTANSIVKRDNSGGFTAGTITASSFVGPLTGNVSGTLTGSVVGNVSGSSGSCTGTAANATTLNGVAASSYALLASPTFTGNPAAPTQTSTDNSTKIATTAFVQGKIGSLGTMATQNAATVTITGGSATFTSGTQTNSLGVGTPPSTTTGEIRATNNITAYFSSDKTLKENIRDIDSAVEKVEAIGGKYFDWTDQYISDHGGNDGYFVTKNSFGVIAQDVQTVFPVAVHEREDGTLAVDYEKLVALAFAAIKELSEELTELKSKVNK